MNQKPKGKNKKATPAPNSYTSITRMRYPTRRRIIATLIVVVIICIATLSILNRNEKTLTHKVTVNSDDIRQKMITARKTLEPELDIKQKERLETLHQAGVVGSPVATFSAKVDGCNFYSKTKEKFITIDWSQSCKIRYADILETPLTRDQILEKLATNDDVGRVFGRPTKLTATSSGSCDSLYYDERHIPTLKFLDWSRGNNLDCQLYNPSAEISATNILHAYSISDVVREKSYLSIIEDDEYFTISLGCGKKDMFGCDKPIQDPITDFTNN